MHLCPHWTERPGWPRHRALLALYLTFGQQPQVVAHVQRYQAVLRDMPGLDLIRQGDLHTTVQGVTWVEDLSPGQRRALTQRLVTELATLPAPRVTVTGWALGSDSVFLRLGSADGLHTLRERCRAVLGEVVGMDHLYVLPGQHGLFDPHISVAYVRETTPVHEVTRRLAAVPEVPLSFEVRDVSLVELGYPNSSWSWRNETRLTLAEAAVGQLI